MEEEEKNKEVKKREKGKKTGRWKLVYSKYWPLSKVEEGKVILNTQLCIVSLSKQVAYYDVKKGCYSQNLAQCILSISDN